MPLNHTLKDWSIWVHGTDSEGNEVRHRLDPEELTDIDDPPESGSSFTVFDCEETVTLEGKQADT